MGRFFQLAAIGLCFLCLSALAETIVDPTKKKGAGPLFRIQRGGKWGYMDRSGQVQIPARFDCERDFFGGLAGVRVEGKWGYINEKGSFAIAPQFDDVRDFRDSLAPVRVGRRWGYIDKTGKVIIAPKFQAAAEFYEGLARVHVWDKLTCERDHYTKDNAPEDYFVLHEELLWDSPTCFPEGGRFGFVDRTGNLAIPLKFFRADDFSEGLAAVRVEETATSKFGYIDRRGAFVISPRFNQAGPFREGLASVETKARRQGNQIVDIAWGFADKTGQLAIPASFQFVGDFSEGLARVITRVGGPEGYLDRQGRTAISPRFSSARGFSDGVAFACDKSGCAYINYSGAVVIKNPQSQWPYRDGLTIGPFRSDKQNYLDKTGKIIAAFKD